MMKDSQDVHCLDPQEEGGYRSEQSFSSSRFSFPAATRFPRLLYGLFTLCAFLLSVLIIFIAVNNSNLKETQKKQEENLSNISLSVQSNFQLLRSDEGSMQGRLISLEGVLKKLESDRSLEGSMQERLISLEDALKKLESDRSLEGSMQARLISLEDALKKLESDRSLEGSIQERLISLEVALKKLESDRSLDLEVLRATVGMLNRDLQNISNKGTGFRVSQMITLDTGWVGVKTVPTCIKMGSGMMTTARASTTRSVSRKLTSS